MNSQFLSDRELVELAADSIKTCVVGWNSLEKKSDALELLIELELNIRHEAWSVVVERFIPTVSVTTAITMGYGREEATKRALTCAAAEITIIRRGLYEI